LKKNLVLRLLERGVGRKKPLFEKKLDFTTFGAGSRAQKAVF